MSKDQATASRFSQDVATQGDALIAAGIGLEGIGLMLAESELSGAELHALHHTVRALGVMVKCAGGDLFNMATSREADQ